MKKILFHQYAGRRILDILRKYLQSFALKYTVIPPRGKLGYKQSATFSCWIPGCHSVTNWHRLDPKTTKSQWLHVASDPARTSPSVYKGLPLAR